MILRKVTHSFFLEFLKFYLKIFFLILLEIDYRGYQIGAHVRSWRNNWMFYYGEQNVTKTLIYQMYLLLCGSCTLYNVHKPGERWVTSPTWAAATGSL